MKQWMCLVCLVGLLVDVLFCSRLLAFGQMFTRGTWQGAVETTVDFVHRDSQTGSSQTSGFESTRTEERFTLKNSGAYVYDPRLLSLSFGGTFGLSQEWRTTDDDSEFREGTLWGYETSASILPGRPWSLILFANRDDSFADRDLAGRTEVRIENLGGTLFARGLPLPSSLAFRHELLETESHTDDILTRQEERRNIVTYEGHREWMDSEIDFLYEFIDLTDEIFPNRNFQSHEGIYRYKADFGSERNGHWANRLRFFNRTGASALVLLNLDKSLSIDHSELLRTDYRFFFSYADTSGNKITSNKWIFALRHQLYESLTTTFEADVLSQSLQAGRRDTYSGRLNFAYTKRLPGDGRLSMSLGTSFEYEDDRFDAAESGVSQETHIATTPFALPITLDNPFVITSSVVVTKIEAGPLPDGCISPLGPPTPLVLDRDYSLRTSGAITEIVPLPCVGVLPGINPGDTIAVDYRFAVPSSLSFTTLAWHASVTVDYQWIRLYFIHEQSEQNLVSSDNDDRFLNDQRSDTAGVELRHAGRRLRASLLGEVRQFDSTRQRFNRIRGAHRIHYVILPALKLNLSGNQVFTEFLDQDRQSLSLAEQVSLTYIPHPNLLADAFVRFQRLTDTLSETDSTIEAGLMANWRFRKLEVNPTLEFVDFQRGDTSTQEYRATLQIIRRF
jgi:hypothetical protein